MSPKTTLTAAQLKDLRGLWRYSQRLGSSHPGYISVTTLATEFGITPATVRRYLVGSSPDTPRSPRARRVASAPAPQSAPEAAATQPDADAPTTPTRRGRPPKPRLTLVPPPAPMDPVPAAPVVVDSPAPSEPAQKAFSVTQVPLEDDAPAGTRKRSRFYVTAKE